MAQVRESQARKFTLEMNGFGGTNTSTPVEHHKRQVTRRNHPAYIHHNFFRSESAQLVYQMKNGTEVVLQKAANPYGVDMQIAALPDYAKSWDSTEIRAIQISDLHQEDRYKINQVINAYLAAVNQLPPPDRTGRTRFGDMVQSVIRKNDENTTVRMITENMQYLSYIDSSLKGTEHIKEGLGPRTPRTIFATHLHGPVIMQNWLKEHQWEIDHLDKQDTMLRTLMQSEYGHEFLGNIRQSMLALADTADIKAYIQQVLKIEPTTEYHEESIFHPTGYSLRLPTIHLQNLTNQETTRLTSELMYLHDKAYALEVVRLRQNLEKNKSEGKPVPVDPAEITAPQPSFSRYIWLEAQQGKQPEYTMTISPTLCSYGGPIEVGGIQLLRDPDRPFPISKKRIDRYHTRVAKKVKHIMWEDSRGESSRIDNLPKWYRFGRRKYNEADLP